MTDTLEFNFTNFITVASLAAIVAMPFLPRPPATWRRDCPTWRTTSPAWQQKPLILSLLKDKFI
jgi:hypothetical protein